MRKFTSKPNPRKLPETRKGEEKPETRENPQCAKTREKPGKDKTAQNPENENGENISASAYSESLMKRPTITSILITAAAILASYLLTGGRCPLRILPILPPLLPWLTS